MRIHHYHRGENGSAISGAWSLYVGEYDRRVSKGWYCVLSGRRNSLNHAEFEVALGGEDNMLQVGGRLPLLGCWYGGIRVPRWMTKGWIYQRRTWKIRFGYVGSWIELLIGFDDDADDMGGYYRRARARGEDVMWSRFATWPGISLKLRPQLRNRLLGRYTMLSEEKVQADVPCVVAMPEGNYPASATVTRAVRGRKRWKPGHEIAYQTEIVVPGGVPFPGKGENSWDCDDDAIFSSYGRGASIWEACASLAGSVMQRRERYGPGLAWVPDKGWPEEIDRGR